jgi:hypothetical protein
MTDGKSTRPFDIPGELVVYETDPGATALGTVILPQTISSGDVGIDVPHGHIFTNCARLTHIEPQTGDEVLVRGTVTRLRTYVGHPGKGVDVHTRSGQRIQLPATDVAVMHRPYPKSLTERLTDELREQGALNELADLENRRGQ